MKSLLTRLAASAAVGTLLSLVPAAIAQDKPAAPATQPRPQKIMIFNIAQVLRDYNKANFQGAEITKKRQAYVAQVQALRDQMAATNTAFTKEIDPTKKKELQDKAVALNRQIEDIDRAAQKELTTLSNETIVRVYQEIKGVVFDIAKTNGLDMVMAYPAASKVEDENSPQVSQLMLQTPALIPFYHQGMDITKYVIETLNARYPSPKAPEGVTPASGTAPPTK